MEIYHRLGEVTAFEEIDAILAELKDRFFGPYPPQVLWLYHLTRLRLFSPPSSTSTLILSKINTSPSQQKDKAAKPPLKKRSLSPN